MSHRRPTPRETRRPSGVRHRLRPSLEGLEGRALMSYGGSPDLSFGTHGQAPFVLPSSNDSFSAAASAVQADGKVVVVGTLDVVTDTTKGTGLEYFAAARYNADGTLDASGFGTGGYFTSPLLSGAVSGSFTNPSIAAQAVAILPDGRIVVVGEVDRSAYVVRLGTGGSLDLTFRGGGLIDLGAASGNSPVLTSADSVAILPNGGVAISGIDNPAGDVVARLVEVLNADSTLDTAFGTGGAATIPVPGSPGNFTLGGSAGLVVQPDGKLVVGGNVSIPNPNVVGTEIVETRLNVDGTLDLGFGTGGQAIINPRALVFTGLSDFATTLATQPDGKLVIGGSSTYADFLLSFGPSSTRQQLLAVRLDADGTLDPTFGIGGADILTQLTPRNSQAGALALQPDGKIVLADRNSSDLARLSTDGLPDPSFGEGGTALVPVTGTIFVNPAAARPSSVSLAGSGLVGVAVQADGKLLAAQGGNTSFGTTGLLRLLGRGAVNDFGDTGITDPSVLIYDRSIFAAHYPGGNTGAGEVVQFGTAGFGNSLPAPGAYDGGGIDEVAVYLPQLGAFAIRHYDGSADTITPFGTPNSSLPAPGDYDGSGKTELAVYQPSINAIIYRPANGGPDVVHSFGFSTTVPTLPAPADYFGTGETNFAFYEPQAGAYHIFNQATGLNSEFPFDTVVAGRDAIPVPGDYDGSGRVDPAVYSPGLGKLVALSMSTGMTTTTSIVPPGGGGSLPAPGDYDGSGHTEVAAFDVDAATLTYLPASGGAAVSLQFGTPGTSAPFTIASDTLSGVIPPPSPAAAILPLTADVLDPLAGSAAKKKAGSA